MEISPDNVVYVYALLDPQTKVVRYVGKTKSMEKRMLTHRHGTDTSACAAWIRQLKQDGKKPGVKLLVVTDAAFGARAEKRWITYFREQGIDLLNMHDADRATLMKGTEIKVPVPTENYLTILEVAQQAGVTENTVRKAIRTGRLAGTRVLDRWLIRPEDVAPYRSSAKIGRPRK